MIVENTVTITEELVNKIKVLSTALDQCENIVKILDIENQRLKNLQEKHFTSIRETND